MVTKNVCAMFEPVHASLSLQCYIVIEDRGEIIDHSSIVLV